MRHKHVIWASFAVATFLLHGEVRAEDAPPAPASGQASPEPAKVEESSSARPADDPFRSIAITANPLSLALLRIGVNVEWLPTAHHAIVLNPFGQFVSAGEEGQTGGKTSYSNFGAELGYRFYTGSRGANGFFVGPFATLLSSSSTTTLSLNGAKTESSASFLAYGGGVDLGGQHVFQNGFTIGGGVGLMYFASSASVGATSSTIRFDGVLPRFLFTAGYSF